MSPVTSIACLATLTLAYAATSLPAMAATESVIFAFKNGYTGSLPGAGLLPASKFAKPSFYGTTSLPLGKVFSVTPDGRYRVLHSFLGGTDGSFPHTKLVQMNGVLYGTTETGGGTGCGGNGCGTVFGIAADGTYSVIYRFAGGNDGSSPTTIVGVGGVLYGISLAGGGGVQCFGGCGTVFSVTPDGKEAVLHAFQAGFDGNTPEGLIEMGGVLYGTTLLGGSASGPPAQGSGTVFAITLQGNETVLHAFNDPALGTEPIGDLLPFGRALYGVTLSGGAGRCNDAANSCGTIYKLTQNGSYSVVHSFTGGRDGSLPSAGLTQLGDLLYGTAYGGGAGGHGVVYALTPQETFSVVHAFSGKADGSAPISSLTASDGALFGTTLFGGGYSDCGINGQYYCGTVFEVTP